MDISSDTLMTGNIIHDNGDNGITIQNGSQNNIISNSNILSNESYGVQIDSSDMNNIYNSYIYNNNNNGINITNSAYITINNSQVYNNAVD